MKKIRVLQFPVAKNNDELVSNIMNFDSELYKEKTKDFRIVNGIIEDGHAAERVVELIK